MIDSALREWFPIIAAMIALGLIWFFNWRQKRPVKDRPTGTPYEIYTTDFDVEIRAADISEQIAKISTDHTKYWRAADDLEWNEAFESAEQIVRNLKRINSFAHLPEDLSDFAICLLVDHSGSMRGQPMVAVTSTVKVVVKALSNRGAAVELLGYTTAGWRGGFARQQWLNRGKKRYPGRLSAVMHIVYKAANDDYLDDVAFKAMLNPGILYENIDGEAIEWAERRLLIWPAKRRLLLVISDGAPVDDSTLTQNGPSILWNHAKQVIARIEAEKSVELGGIGINCRTDELYQKSVTVEDLSLFPEITSTFIRGMLMEQAH
ncbi:hypothetical protein [Sphingorhabdus sp.]|jgi:cobaltochelatase CobT|uniref:cobaltochelatase CobT-related protein n=1 Tax=Sphingorhabdus sp. TaxID=1902408 RepID=UPI0037C5EB86